MWTACFRQGCCLLLTSFHPNTQPFLPCPSSAKSSTLYLPAIAAICLILPGRRINIPVLPRQHGRSGSGVWTFPSSDWTSILGIWISTYPSYLCAMFGPSPYSLIAISSTCGPHSSIHGSSLLECFGDFSTVSSEGSI